MNKPVPRIPRPLLLCKHPCPRAQLHVHLCIRNQCHHHKGTCEPDMKPREIPSARTHSGRKRDQEILSSFHHQRPQATLPILQTTLATEAPSKSLKMLTSVDSCMETTPQRLPGTITPHSASTLALGHNKGFSPTSPVCEVWKK